MKIYFTQNNWEPKAYQRLNEIIDQYRADKESPDEQKNYVVFDFDNTSAINDIEDNLMFYMMQNLSYKLSPQKFYSILTTGPFDFEEILFQENPKITLSNLSKDIFNQYTWLYENYIAKETSSRPSLKEIHQSEQFKDFSAKLRLYYNLANGILDREPGHPWVTYWFANYTEIELSQLVREALDYSLEAEYKNIELQSSDKFPGETGVIHSSFESGLTFPEELLNLYHTFEANGIVVYIVSASPIGVVQVAGNHYEFNIPKERIYGMKYSVNEEGKIQASIKENSYITKKEGKTQVIRKFIQSQHLDKEPIALFGDSMGDYDMMTTFKNFALNVLFNRYMDNQTKSIVKLAVEQYDQPNSQYVVQGRDENLGQLIPSMKTIPLGHSKAILTSEEFEGIRSLSE